MTSWEAVREVCAHLRVGLLEGATPPARNGIRWKSMIAAGSRHNVTPALAYCCRNQEGVPDDVRAYFEAVLELNTHRNALLLDALERTVRSLAPVVVEPVLLKGAAALVEGLYPTSGARVLGDLDVLIPADRATDAVRALERDGFRRPAAGHHDFTGHHHLAPMVDRVTDAQVELHTAVLPSGLAGILPAAAFEGDAVPMPFRGLRVRLPSATGRVAHNIAHSAIVDGLYDADDIELRQLLDLVMIRARHGGEIDWRELAARFVAAGFGRVLSTTLQDAAELFGVPAPRLEDVPPPRDVAVLARAMRWSRLHRGLRVARPYAAWLRRNPSWIVKWMSPRRLPERVRRVLRELTPPR